MRLLPTESTSSAVSVSSPPTSVSRLLNSERWVSLVSV